VVFEVVSGVVSVLEVVALVVGLESLQVVSLLGVLLLVLNMGDGRNHSFEIERRDGPRSSFHGFGPPPVREGWFPHSGVRGGSFGRKGVLDCANPTFEQMAKHWFYSFGTNPVLSRLFAHVRVFEFQVGELKNIWLTDSGCSRHMTGDKGWFSSLVPVVTKRYITFGDNGHGCVLLEGEIKVSDKITLRRVALVQSLVYNLLSVSQLLDEGFEVLFRPGGSRIWTLEGTLSVWSLPRVRCFELIFLSLLVLSVVSWLVLRVSCGSGIGSWVT
jgi:hypothetical protein